MCKFLRKSSFQATYNKKTEKQTIHLILRQLDMGGWQQEKLFFVVYSLKKRTAPKIYTFCPVSSERSFNLLCIWIFF